MHILGCTLKFLLAGDTLEFHPSNPGLTPGVTHGLKKDHFGLPLNKRRLARQTLNFGFMVPDRDRS